MKNKIIVIVISVLLSTSLVYAEYFGGRDVNKDGLRQLQKAEVIKKLGVTETQQDLFEKHKKSSRARGIELRMSLQDLQVNLGDELNKYDSNMEEVERISLEVKNIQAKLIDHRVAAILEIKKILTAEQYKKFRAMIREFRSKRIMRRGKK